MGQILSDWYAEQGSWPKRQYVLVLISRSSDNASTHWISQGCACRRVFYLSIVFLDLSSLTLFLFVNLKHISNHYNPTFHAMDEFSVSVGKQNAGLLAGRMDLKPGLSSAMDSDQRTQTGETGGTGEQHNRLASDQVTSDLLLPCTNDPVPDPIGDVKTGFCSLTTRFIDELHKHIPENSALMQSIRSRDSSALIINELNADGAASPLDNLVDNLRHISSRRRSTALVIKDINPDWAQALLDEYHNSISATFFLEHMARFDSFSATEKAVEQLKGDVEKYCLETKLSISLIESERKIKKIGLEFRRPPASNGNHIDILLDDVRKETIPPDALYSGTTRRDVFEQTTDGSWKKLSTRMSWCRLNESICTV